MNVEYIYETVKSVFKNTEVIYEEYLIYLVGFEGYYVLVENDLLEKRGIVDGRKAYVLRDKEVLNER